MGTQWIKHKDGIAWEESGQLHRAGLCHGVTGRTGGVSPAPYHSLNLALHVGDSVSCVLENRRRLCAHLGCRLDVLTTPQQTHEDHVIAVGDSEIGRGAGSYHDAFPHTDALMTSRPGVLLLICIADCVPVILYDPVKKACAVIHDGWRGTASRLASKTVFAMQTVYGSQPLSGRLFPGSISRSVKRRQISSAIWDRPMPNVSIKQRIRSALIYGRQTSSCCCMRGCCHSTSIRQPIARIRMNNPFIHIVAMAVIPDGWQPSP